MIGPKTGFTVTLGKKLGTKNILVHHCLSHRNQLMVRNVLKEEDENGDLLFEMFLLLEKDLGMNYNFHRSSHKNYAHLKQYSRSVKAPVSRPPKIMPTRWATSSYRALKTSATSWPVWIPHLNGIVTSPKYNAKAKMKSKKIIQFLTDKHAMAALHYLLDILYAFKGMSQVSQRSGESIIGQKDLKTAILAALDTLLAEGGKWMNKFLQETVCDVNSILSSCGTLENFEKTLDVTWHGYPLKGYQRQEVEMVPVKDKKKNKKDANNEPNDESEDSEGIEENEENDDSGRKGKNMKRNQTKKKRRVVKWYKPVSTIREAHIQKLKDLVEAYWPENDLMEVSAALDQTKWPEEIEKVLENPTVMTGIKKWAKALKLDEEITEQQITDDFTQLIQTLKNDHDVKWCNHWQSSNTAFWSLLLMKGKLPQRLQKLAETILIIPYGSSDCERAFSLMNLLKPVQRASLSPETLNMLMTIRYRKEKTKDLDLNRLTNYYLLHHRECDIDISSTKTSSWLEMLKKDPNNDNDVESVSSGSSVCSWVSSASSCSIRSLPGEEESEESPKNDDHPYAFDRCAQKLIVRDPKTAIFAIVNTVTGKALTARKNKIQVHTWGSSNDQLWFLYGDHIISLSGKALQVNEELEMASLEHYDPMESKQIWTLQQKGKDFDHFIKSKYDNLKLDLLQNPLFRSSIDVGGRKRNIDAYTVAWKINYITNPSPTEESDNEMDDE